MKYLVLFVLIIVVAGGIYYSSQNQKPPSNISNTSENTGSSKITTEQARMVVQNLPEVQDYLKEVPNGKVEVDNELEGEYNVHVYEIKDGHTATFNWYRVSIKTGEVRSEFPIEQNEQEQNAQEQQQPSKSAKEPPKSITGTVSGKICYPSEVVPEGKLEVKRLSDGKITVENYPGAKPGQNVYSFQLEKGIYYIRYKVSDTLIGYSTTACPTGMEETCGDTKPRVLRKAEVKIGETISGYDLCDYYYKNSNAPKF